MIRRIHRKSNNSRNSVKRFESGRSNSRSRNIRNTRSRRFETQRVNNRSLRRRFEAFESQDNFENAYRELQSFAKKLVKEYGEEVTDEMNVVFWAKDENGTPCLVEGAYNYWSGDAELTMTEIANGASPNGFISKLDKCIDRRGAYVAEYYAEAVAEDVIDRFDLDIYRTDLQSIIWNDGDTSVDFQALISYLRDDCGIEIDDEDRLIDDIENSCGDHDNAIIEYGWEYSTVEQGNLWYGRSNHADGPIFGEVVLIGGYSENIREWDGNDAREDINEKGLRKLADAIAQGKTERPRW